MSENPGGLPSFSAASPTSGLGSLSQSARQQSLRQARGILIAIGVLTIVANGFLLAQAMSEVDQALNSELQKEGLDPANIDPGKLAEAKATALRLTQLIYGGTIALGVVFILLGVLIYRAPVAMTVTGLVLYIAAAIAFALLNPVTLLGGLIVKILIIAGLAKAIQTAVAYQRNQTAPATA